ncbi:hypothetical protein [Pseudonocardia xishanensis]|uniref:Uncharacterized protein n=1 Tax=Pseudonocardia xishanensis TaxID=630995 RepID=A0ABP8RQG4_9PSEU
MLLITSQVAATHLGRGRGYVHEAENQAAMLRSVCRDVVSPTSACRLPPRSKRAHTVVCLFDDGSYGMLRQVDQGD